MKHQQDHSTAENAATSSTKTAPATESAPATTNCAAARNNASTHGHKRVYISIPITGLPLNSVREKADMIKASLSRQGYTPVSPFDVYPGKDPAYEDYICCDLRAMLDCDAVFFCHGWQLSCGCNIEHDVAMRFKTSGRRDFKLMYER